MVRTSADSRTDDDDKPRRMTWDGDPATARKLIVWSADESLNTRFAWNPQLHAPDEARTLVQRPYPASAEWMPTPVGSVIERLGREDDAPLRVILPPKQPDPITILEEK